MKKLRYFALVLAIGALCSVTGYAQKGPNPGNGDLKFGPNHFGLSDSCWNVFLSRLSASDAAKLTADEKTLADNEAQIDTLQSQINALIRNSGGKDSTLKAKIRTLDSEIRALNMAGSNAQLEIGTIIKNNNSLLAAVEDSCGRRHPKGGGGKDTSKGPGKIGNPKGHFGLSDSCWNIFLGKISATDASGLANDQATIAGDEAQVDSLQKLIHSLLKAGGGKDSTIRNEVKALLAQIQTLRKAMEDAAKDYASIIRNNIKILQSVRDSCGRMGHKGSAGDPGNGLTVTNIVPNPATVGGSISLTIGLTSEAEVNIFASLIGPQGPPAIQIFHGNLPAGSNPETISLGRLGAGAYMITIQSGPSMVQEKLVIQ